MSIFSRRKRLLIRTSARASSGRAASGRAQFRKIFRRNRTATPGMPKMSSRRQFHRALRRHPAWPMVMGEAAARAQRAQEAVKSECGGVIEMGRASGRSHFRRVLRRNRALALALIAVGGLVALLTGVGAAFPGAWIFTGQGPEARFGAATTFDMTRGEMLIFGGFGTNQASGSAFDETWGYNSAQTSGGWTKRSSVHKPSKRGFASMAYDDARRNVVLFGGAPYNTPTAVSGETWTWDGVDWTLHQPLGARPAARQNASMVYDAHRKVVLMFGGRSFELGAAGSVSETILDDTWMWNGSIWKKISTPGGPFPRHSAAMAYDVCRAEAVMFGGVGSSREASTQPQETWTWNGAKWTLEAPVLSLGRTGSTPAPYSPGRRIGASMTYSYATGEVLMYGGLYTTDTAASTVANDDNLWRWDGASWEKETYADVKDTAFDGPVGGPSVIFFPPPRAYASFAFDRRGGSGSQLFGGTLTTDVIVGRNAPQVALSDHWTFFSPSVTGGPLPLGGSLDETIRSRPRICSNPVPIPSDGATVAGENEGPELRKVDTRDEIKEIDRLPVLLGAMPNPHPTSGPNASFPSRTHQPPCIRGDGAVQNKSRVADTHLATDSKRNRVYQFYVCQNVRIGSGNGSSSTIGTGTGKVLIQSYDATTLKPLGSVLALMPDLQSPQGMDFGGFHLLHDIDRGRFLLHTGNQMWVIQQDLIEQSKNPVVRYLSLPSPGVAVNFFNHPKTGRAKLLLVSGSAIAQFDLDGPRTDVTDWSSNLAPCLGGNAAGGMRIEDRVYTICKVSSDQAQFGVVRISVETDPANANLERVKRDTSGNPIAEAFPGPFHPNTSVPLRVWGDQKVERMLLLSDTPFGSTVWAFDGKVSRYVGRSAVAGTGSAYSSWGFDRETGRLYLLKEDHKIQGQTGFERTSVQGGLVVVDTRLTPVPQPTNFAQFSYPSQAVIGILPPGSGLPTRLFVRRASNETPSDPNNQQQVEATADRINRYPDGDPVTLKDEMHYLVLADSLPVPEIPELSQLDALTIGVAENPSKTEVSFDAEGSGYGIRLRSVGGIASVLRNQSGTGLLDTPDPAHIPVCVWPDRELISGWVSQARLSDLETSAAGSGLEVDPTTKSDLEGPSTRCFSPGMGPNMVPASARAVANILWPLLPFTQIDSAAGGQLRWAKHFKEVECAGDSSVTHTASIGNVYGLVTCEEKKARVAGTSRGALAGSVPSGYSVTNTLTSSLAASPVDYSVGEGYSNVVVAREPGGRGVVVTTTAEARGIKLPGITIGYVKMEAVAWSNGRPSDQPRASFTRTICRVSPPPNNHPEACLDQAAQKKMADDFNARSGVNAKMTLPTPDPDFFKGTPGGYIAGVTKPVADEIEQQFFARDFQRELPALQIVFDKDSQARGPGRQILQLAAVRAVAALGVQCGPDFVYSSTSKDCVALSFEDDPVEFFEEEEEFESTEDAAFNSYDDGGGWTPVEATGSSEGVALGSRLGRYIQTLPIIRQLPIRAVGEAALAASVWMLLGMPLVLASRRFALNLARRS